MQKFTQLHQQEIRDIKYFQDFSYTAWIVRYLEENLEMFSYLTYVNVESFVYNDVLKIVIYQ